MNTKNGWIGVDLDATLATYTGWKGPYDIGQPIEPMVSRVKAWIGEGKEVRIMTARVAPFNDNRDLLAVVNCIKAWCLQHIGHELPVTCTKDHGLIELWDDRAVGVVPNTGLRADGKP